MINFELIATLEALLFAHGEPLNIKKIGEILAINVDEATILINNFNTMLEQNERGLMIIEHNGYIQLVTKPAYADMIEKLLKGELREELTPAAQETLALIVYGGPIMKTAIEYIRGVHSSFILRNLQIRGLIEKTTGTHRGNCYHATTELIRHLGLKKIIDLPEYETHRQVILAAISQSSHQ